MKTAVTMLSLGLLMATEGALAQAEKVFRGSEVNESALVDALAPEPRGPVTRSIVIRPLFNIYPIAYWTRLFPFPSGIKNALLWSLHTSRIGNIPLKLPAGNLVAWGFR